MSRASSTLPWKVARASLFVLFAVLLVSLSTSAQRGVRVRQQNLAELAAESNVVFHGRVKAVASEPHPQFTNLQTVVVTLDVLEVLKGQPGTAYTFRQFVLDERDVRDKMGYQVGQEYLLMMIKPSQHGLSSPAGQDQGRFLVTADERGNRFVVNGVHNFALFERVEKTAPKLADNVQGAARQTLTSHRRGPISLDHLKTMIQALASSN